MGTTKKDTFGKLPSRSCNNGSLYDFNQLDKSKLDLALLLRWKIAVDEKFSDCCEGNEAVIAHDTCLIYFSHFFSKQ